MSTFAKCAAVCLLATATVTSGAPARRAHQLDALLEKAAPTPPSATVCSLVEEMRPYGCSLNKYHGTPLAGYPLRETKKALEVFYLHVAQLQAEGDQLEGDKLVKCLPAVKELVCDTFVPRCTAKCVPSKPCRARCADIHKDCLTRGMLSMLQNSRAAGSLRGRLEGLVTDVEKGHDRKVILRIVDRAIGAVTSCASPAYSDRAGQCVEAGVPPASKTCTVPAESVVPEVSATVEDEAMLAGKAKVPEPTPRLDQVEDSADETKEEGAASGATGADPSFALNKPAAEDDEATLKDSGETGAAGKATGPAEDHGERWVEEAETGSETGGETGSETGSETGGETGSETGGETGSETGGETGSEAGSGSESSPSTPPPATAAPLPTPSAALQHGLKAGETRVPMEDPKADGFQIGQTVQIGEGEGSEARVVVGLRGLVLDRPLSKTHELGSKLFIVSGPTGFLKETAPADRPVHTPVNSPALHISTVKHVKPGQGHVAWIPGTALHSHLNGKAGRRVVDEEGALVPHTLKEGEMGYKPCPKCGGENATKGATGGEASATKGETGGEASATGGTAEDEADNGEFNPVASALVNGAQDPASIVPETGSSKVKEMQKEEGEKEQGEKTGESDEKVENDAKKEGEDDAPPSAKPAKKDGEDDAPAKKDGEDAAPPSGSRGRINVNVHPNRTTKPAKKDGEDDAPPSAKPVSPKPSLPCVPVDGSTIEGCPNHRFFSHVAVEGETPKSIAAALKKFYSYVPMLSGFLGHVSDKCIADLKAGICTLALPSCGAKCTGRVACRSECKAIHASCGSFVSKDTLGPIQPGGAMEGIVKGMVGDDEMFSAMQKLMKMILCEGDLAEAECSKGEDFAKAKDVCDQPQLRRL